MRWWISLALCTVAAAGPIEFGLAEYNAALSARGVKWKIVTDLSLDAPETFRIEPYKAGGAHISGGDLRGLMYGLLEAAEQVRATGRFAQARGVPAIALRGIRVFVRPADFEKVPDNFWRAYFEMLARNRFNRFNFIFLDQTPYPYLIAVDSFPGVRIPGLPADQRERNLRKLRFISQTANDFAIDFTLGMWEDTAPLPEGLTSGNLGPYTRDALRQLLSACPMIRSVQMQTASENVTFYRNYVFKALHEAGRRVTLDPRGSLRQGALAKAAQDAGVALHPAFGAWPGGYEIDPPLSPGHWEFESHLAFYALWGRLTYDPSTKPPKGDDADQYRAANQAIHLLVAAQEADPNMFTWPPANPSAAVDDFRDPHAGEWGFVESIPEAVHRRLHRGASAKQTPLETADLLLAASAALEKASNPDLRMLAKLAQYHAHKQRSAYDLELFDRTKDNPSLDRAEQELNAARAAWEGDLADVRRALDQIAQRGKDREGSAAVAIPAVLKALPRPQLTHAAIKSAFPEQELTVTIQIGSLKDARAVRLHYRAAAPMAQDQTIEKPAAASVSFTIPASDVPSGGDFLYYFEILNRENGGWFELDPLTTLPYHVVTIAPPP